jgi:hypothetical protein
MMMYVGIVIESGKNSKGLYRAEQMGMGSVNDRERKKDIRV